MTKHNILETTNIDRMRFPSKSKIGRIYVPGAVRAIAERRPILLAVFALSASDLERGHDALSGLDFGDIRTDFVDDSDKLQMITR